MKKTYRLLLITLAAVVVMGAIGFAYEYLVKPQQAVWNEETPVHWDKNKLPLTVRSIDYPEALEAAVSLWNMQARFDLFRIAKDGETPTIIIKQGTIEVGVESEDWAAGAFVNKDTTRGEIIVYVPLMVGTDLQVLHHELGHILGLAHDRAYTMKPIIEEDIDGRQKMVRAQDKDIEALRERYGN